jgi:hypothetical protein
LRHRVGGEQNDGDGREQSEHPMREFGDHG